MDNGRDRAIKFKNLRHNCLCLCSTCNVAAPCSGLGLARLSYGLHTVRFAVHGSNNRLLCPLYSQCTLASHECLQVISRIIWNYGLYLNPLILSAECQRQCRRRWRRRFVVKHADSEVSESRCR